MIESWQNAIESYLIYLDEYRVLQALIIFLVAWFLAWILDGIIIGFLRRLTRKTRFNFDDHLLQLLHHPLYTSIILIGLASATLVLALGDTLEPIIFSVLKMLALLIWVRFIMRLSRYVLHGVAKNQQTAIWLHPQTLPLFENIASIVIVVFAIYYLFSLWNIDMTAWLASAGIVGIAVGFAAKDTLANLFSGVFILADAPYKIGDFIVLDGVERGEVTKIGLRSTRLLTRDDVEVTVPNSVMGNSKIINESGGPHEKFRIGVKVGVAYGSDIDTVRKILMAVAQGESQVCQTPEPRVRMREFGASSLDFELLCWISQPVLRGRILDSLNCAVYKQFIEQGIEIPYSKQDVYIKSLPPEWRSGA
jgi:small-conductance mechanosensitive channel